MSSTAHPHPRSYWVADRLVAGCYPGDLDPQTAREKIAALLGAGVTHFVSLMEEDERDYAGNRFESYEPIARLGAGTGVAPSFSRHAIVDESVPTTAEMSATLDRIDSIRAAGGTAYVHCWGGRGRTGTVIACWLVRHGHARPEDAVAHLQTLLGPRPELFTPTPSHAKQRDFVAAWGEGQ